MGLVVPDLIHPYFAEIAKSLSISLRENNFFLVVAASDHDPLLEQAEIEHILAHRLDALVVASVQSHPHDLERIQKDGPPLILFDRTFENFACNYVGLDDCRVGEIAVEHLRKAGKRRIAHIRGPENSVSRARLKGYLQAMAKDRRKGDRELVITPQPSTDGRDSGEQGMEQILRMKQRPNALFCYNDAMALGAMVQARKSGLRIPEDIAIIGCGNYPYADALHVPLSSIDQQVKQVGDRIAKLIFTLLKAEGPSKPRTYILEPKLVLRSSTQKGK